MATAIDLAKLIVDEVGDEMTTYKVQKLLYYSQAWSLARLSSPIFDEEVLAYPKGPLVHSVFVEHRGARWVRESHVSSGRPSTIDRAHRDVVGEVLGFYGEFTAAQLVALTHAERPWNDAFAKGEKSIVSKDAMRTFYSGKTFERTLDDAQVFIADRLARENAGLMSRLAE